MLTPPTRGFAISVTKHNVEVDALAEWIEGCVTFDEKVVSRVDVLDVLLEENYYREQDFAKVRISDGWKELERRMKCLGAACPFKVTSSNVQHTKDWTDTPAYSFCLMLSLQVSYRPAFTKKFGTDYTEQGLLFERLTTEAMGAIGWSTHATGWSKAASNSIADKVAALATHLGEPSRADAIRRWTDDHAKDGGLDVVCHLPFADGWAGRPVFYVQCASGDNWKEKRATPNLSLWDKLLDLATRPKRGLSMPFALLADEFRRAANSDDLSLVLDRHRLCTPGTEMKPNWISKGLAHDLNKWTKARLPTLLKAKAS